MRLPGKTIRVEKNDNVKKEDRHGQFNFHGKATLNEEFPVLKLYYNQARSSLTAKRVISGTKVVLQPSALQPGPQTRHFQY